MTKDAEHYVKSISYKNTSLIDSTASPLWNLAIGVGETG